jgi:NAD(P)-dependent dehydrogenase (short-subunit alcohol dehydrogenase family)
LVQAAELGRYGITANAICPIARTRMTEGAFADAMKAPDQGFDENDPANVSPFIAWLASSQSREVTGRVWEIVGGTITAFVDIGKRWDAAEVGPAVKDLLSKAKPLVKVYGT